MMQELDERSFKRMEASLVDDANFKEQVKKLEDKFGNLVSNEVRERLHLEKGNLYARENQQNLTEMVKRLRQVRELSKETAEIVNDDTEKLRAAFEVVDRPYKRAKI